MDFMSMSQKIVECEVCKKEFLTVLDSVSDDEKMFCSGDCIEKFNGN